jgi:uncharacterized protein (DUF2147 family)
MTRVFALILMGLCLATATLAEPILGTWRTQTDDGTYAHVVVGPCGAAFCGTIARTFHETGEYDAPSKGRRIVRDMVPMGDGAYQGRVWRPSNDRVYQGRIRISGDRMALRGCVAGGLICARQDWVRIE